MISNSLDRPVTDADDDLGEGGANVLCPARRGDPRTR